MNKYKTKKRYLPFKSVTYIYNNRFSSNVVVFLKTSVFSLFLRVYRGATKLNLNYLSVQLLVIIASFLIINFQIFTKWLVKQLEQRNKSFLSILIIEGGQMLISRFKNNPMEEVRVDVRKFRVEKYIDIRVWYDASENGESDYRPSTKGITLNINLFDDLKEAVLKAEKEIEKQLPDA